MALRIAGKKPTPPPVEEELQAAPETEMPVEEPMPEEALPTDELGADPTGVGQEELGSEGGGVIDPVIAGYRGPEMGPFMCGNCVHFAGNGVCDLLSSPVDEMGVCNLFTAPAPEDDSAAMEEEMPTDQPPQEPMPEGEPYPEEEPTA